VASTESIFQKSALASGLVTQEQLDEVVRALHDQFDGMPGPAVKIHDSQLAEKLVEMEVLSAYQADQLRAGRTKLDLGPYLIKDWIGQGGMGQVFKAEHKMMGREVAVKVLPLTRSTPEAVERFNREIRTQAQLDHANLVRAFDAGHDGNVYYLVTEFVPGTDLRRLVRTAGVLTMQQAAGIVIQAAKGLEHAHTRGLVHRDVKPGNILVTPEGVAKVSDLGLAGFKEDANAGSSKPTKIVGTADYLSPDQIKDPRHVTPGSDIYSLGCTLYYAVTGKVPFPGGKPRDKARRHCEDTPWHPHRFNTALSDDFIDVIADMMEKDPTARVQTAAEVATRLEPWSAEASLLPTKQTTKSPWTLPPVPSNAGVEGELSDTDAGSGALDAGDYSSQSSVSQGSQGTDPIASAMHETRSGRDARGTQAPSIPQPDPDEPMTLFSPCC